MNFCCLLKFCSSKVSLKNIWRFLMSQRRYAKEYANIEQADAVCTKSKYVVTCFKQYNWGSLVSVPVNKVNAILQLNLPQF